MRFFCVSIHRIEVTCSTAVKKKENDYEGAIIQLHSSLFQMHAQKNASVHHHVSWWTLRWKKKWNFDFMQEVRG